MTPITILKVTEAQIELSNEGYQRFDWSDAIDKRILIYSADRSVFRGMYKIEDVVLDYRYLWLDKCDKIEDGDIITSVF